MKNIFRYFCLFVYKIVASLPLPVRIFIGRKGACFLSMFFRRENAFIRLQTKAFLGKEIKPSKIYESIGQTYFETMNLNDIKEENVKIYGLNDEEYEYLKSMKKPSIVLTAHTGNWELLAAYFIKMGLPIATAAKTTRIAIGQELISRVRDKYGIKTIWRGGQAGLREILEVINQNHFMAALIDQHTRVTSLKSTFFGHEVLVPYSLIKLGKKHDANIILALNFREDKYHYSFYLKLLDSSKSEEEIVKEYNDILESLIRKYPEQWVWFHKRWRCLNGKELSRRDYKQHLIDLIGEKTKFA